MAVERKLLLPMGTSLAGGAQPTDYMDVIDAKQAILECYPAGLTGLLQVVIEFTCAPTPSSWLPETVDDIAGGAVVGNDYNIPVRRAVRTWSQNLPFPIAMPVGATHIRAIVSSSNNVGTVGIFLTKVKNLGG